MYTITKGPSKLATQRRTGKAFAPPLFSSLLLQKAPTASPAELQPTFHSSPPRKEGRKDGG
uniref:Uncharacterized protein n=1 Tax=Laticauda laticaudata TaxID=8630 RepID=A0A8C5WS22_LATLA